MALSASPTIPSFRSPREVQTKNDAVRFLLEVKCAFRDNKEKYAEFLHFVKSFGRDGIGKDEVILRAKQMFDGHPELVVGFNAFLPKGKKIHVAYGQ
ncbi:hypothetical protein MLD38_026149 [Melastoma candidum]|uniref:Uncharacterized protein n=1 Tax=Melastoma candidum TaxID=119954 RepID=A0ACB9NYN5_9MYRT|nr:hypothetical protein MLD38_026149 [Melastoma candidum]